MDYGGAVANGAVLKESEYAEMQEFTTTAERQLSELPNQAGKETLLRVGRDSCKNRQKVT